MALKALHAQKAKTQGNPWQNGAEPVQQVTAAAALTQQRKFDPILQQHRDPATEHQARHTQSATATRRGNLARDQQLKHQQSFDIVNHRALVDDPTPRNQQRASQSFLSRTSYNIVSNEQLAAQRTATAGGASRDGGAPRPGKNYSHTTGKYPRSFNVLSNRYLDQHEQKEALDKEVALRQAADRFWQTRNFNTVTGQFYDDARDARIGQEAQEREQRCLQAAQALPASVQRAEGTAYNVVNNAPKSSRAAADVDSRAVRPGRVQHRLQRETEMKSHEGAVADVAAARSIAKRQSAARLAEHAKGYDVISNMPYRGVQGRASAAAAVAGELLSTASGTGMGGAGASGFAKFSMSGNLRGEQERFPGGSGAGSMASLRMTAYDRLLASKAAAAASRR